MFKLIILLISLFIDSIYAKCDSLTSSCPIVIDQIISSHNKANYFHLKVSSIHFFFINILHYQFTIYISIFHVFQIPSSSHDSLLLKLYASAGDRGTAFVAFNKIPTESDYDYTIQYGNAGKNEQLLQTLPLVCYNLISLYYLLFIINSYSLFLCI